MKDADQGSAGELIGEGLRIHKMGDAINEVAPAYRRPH